MSWNINLPDGTNIGTSRRRYVRTTASKPLGRLGGALFALAGFGMLGGAAYFGMKTHELVTKGLHAEGIVADVQQHQSTKTRTHNGYRETYTAIDYTFTVDFKDSKGASVEFKDPVAQSSKSWQKGDKVDVLYLENDPKGSANINRGAMNWMVPGILGFIGLIFAGVGTMTVIRGGGSAPPPSGPDQYTVPQ